MVESDTTTIKIGHALGARKEMKLIADEFRALAKKTSVPTPAMDHLYQYVDPQVEPIADGSAEMPLSWSGVWMALGVLAGSALLLSLLLR
jgi:hypothetical protein